MKNQTGIWIDSSRAIIVNLKEGEENVKEIESNIDNRVHHDGEGDKGSFKGQLHISNEKKFDRIEDQQMSEFLDEVISNVRESDEVYVFGPAETKDRLRSKIIEEGQNLKFQLKSVETSDSMTLNQVVAQVKSFFSH